MASRGGGGGGGGDKVVSKFVKTILQTQLKHIKITKTTKNAF